MKATAQEDKKSPTLHSGKDVASSLETYSNAIVAFVVIQSITFSTSFGTSDQFNCILTSDKLIPFGILASHVLVIAAACFANGRLSGMLAGLSDEVARKHIATLYKGKTVAIVLFAIVPMGLSLGYAAYLAPWGPAPGESAKRCGKAAQAADQRRAEDFKTQK